jgi:hypothetical protein
MSFTATSYASVIMRDGPIRYFRLGETSGTTAADSSSSAQNGTLNGTVTLNQTGLITGDPNAAMLFDGSTGFVSCPSTGLPTGAASFSLEAWAKMPTPLQTSQSFGIIVAYGGSTTNSEPELYFQKSDSTLRGDAGGTQPAGVTAVAGTTYHLVLTYDGSILRFYSNGTQAGTATVTVNVSLSFAKIGAEQATTSHFFQGTIDEVAIYNKVLTADQILRHYQAGIQGLILQPRSRTIGRVL